MCVVSMVMDHQLDKWREQYPPGKVTVLPNLPSQAEIDEFRRLLERAREYDRRNNEPDCENDGKKRLLLDMAKQLGVDISFINEGGEA